MATAAKSGTDNSGGPGEPASTPLPVLALAMALVIVPLIILSQLIAYWRTDVVDDQMFGYYGWRILHGARPYLDVWDNKPPGIYWINAFGMLLGGGHYLGVIAVCAAALVVAHVAFFVAATSVYRREAAGVATVLLAFYLMHGYYTGGTNRTETFLVACELSAVALYLRGYAADRWWKWFAAGLLCGAAFLFKQVGLVAWGCMGLHTIGLVVTRNLRIAAGAKRCVLLLVGAATTVGLAAAALAAQGALGAAWHASFAFNRAYFVTGDTRFPYNYASYELMKDHLLPIMLLPLLMATAAAIHALLWWLRPQYRPAEIEGRLRDTAPVCRGSFALFVLWFLLAFYGAVLSPSRFRHYLVPAIPPLLLAAGYLVNVLLAEASLLRRLQQRAWVTAAFVIMGYFAWGAVVRQFEEVSKVYDFRFDQHERAEWEAVGDEVARHSGPQDRLQCFGYMPGVYLRARRLNATRFTTTEKVGQVQAEAHFVVAEVEEHLRRDPPALLAIPAGDYFWMRDGVDRDGRPSDFKLHGWLLENYQLVADVPKFNVYIFKRRDLIDPARDPNLDALLPKRPAAS